MAALTFTALSTGDRLPPLQGEYLTGRKATLPDASSGKIAFLATGFTYDSRWAVESWTNRFRKDFGDNPRVTFYEVPIIGGMAKMGKWFIDSGMRKGTPKSDHEHVITVYNGSSEWKERLGYQAPDAAYLILLDPAGNVLWRYTGGFDEEAYRNLASVVNKQLGKEN